MRRPAGAPGPPTTAWRSRRWSPPPRSGSTPPKLTVEQRATAVLCHEILSIAEVSARLHLPLGVIRILVGDMADEHLVMVHRPAQAGDHPDLTLLEWVLDGLHSI
jgi:Protein of unknown function (DUF742)